ncbi:hypothetical protein GCM10027610_010040 [Dactylosporangium cerinum]
MGVQCGQEGVGAGRLTGHLLDPDQAGGGGSVGVPPAAAGAAQQVRIRQGGVDRLGLAVETCRQRLAEGLATGGR